LPVKRISTLFFCRRLPAFCSLFFDFLPMMRLFVNIVVGWKWPYALAAGSMLSYSYYAVFPAAEQYGVEMAVWAIAAALAVAEYRAEYRARKTFSRSTKMAKQ
jgi:hypothetical protein